MAITKADAMAVCNQLTAIAVKIDEAITKREERDAKLFRDNWASGDQIALQQSLAAGGQIAEQRLIGVLADAQEQLVASLPDAPPAA